MKVNLMLSAFICFLVGATAFQSLAQETNSSPNATNSMTVEELKTKAESGDAVSQINLGKMYENGQGVSQDQTEAVKWYRKAAVQGDDVAQFNLGIMYDNGYGATKDET